MMEENIRLVDLVIELVDARIPMSSRNPDIDALCRGKGRVVLLCKADLADPVKTEAFLEFFREKGFLAVAVDARERRTGEIVRRYVQEACQEKLARDRARGIVGRPLRAMVAGIPNVGKSTFINSFAGRASTKTGNKPGVTRGKQWIRLGGGVELLDTPGILWPKFDDPSIGMRLALAGAIRDEVLDREELALWLLQLLEQEYPGAVREKYLQAEPRDRTAVPEREEVSERDEVPEERDGEGEAGRDFPPLYALLMEIALARQLLRKGGGPDTERAAAMLVDDCRNGRIGRISLDRPQDAEAMMALQTASSASADRGSGAGKAKGGGTPPRGRKSGPDPSAGGGKRGSGAGASGNGRNGGPGRKQQAGSSGKGAGRGSGKGKRAGGGSDRGSGASGGNRRAADTKGGRRR